MVKTGTLFKILGSLVFMAVMFSSQAYGAVSCNQVHENRKTSAKTLPETENLRAKLKTFLRNNSDKAAFLKNVKMQSRYQRDQVVVSEGKNNLLVISTKDLTAEAAEALKRDYLELMSENTVGFPMSPGGEHLFMRVDGKTVDWANTQLRLEEYDYSVKSNMDRLETIIVVKADEKQTIQNYIAEVRRDGWTVVGFFHINGSYNTTGDFRRNAPAGGERHNCTSWICTLRVGNENQRLMDIVDREVSGDWGLNPGLWTTHLAMHSPEVRSPFVILWTKESVEEATSRIKKSENLEWDFNPWDGR